MVEQVTQREVIRLNNSVKLRFREGDELVIRIVEQKPPLTLTADREEMLVESITPLAQAILGHGVGEEIEYIVEKAKQQVIILEVS